MSRVSLIIAAMQIIRRICKNISLTLLQIFMKQRIT